MAADTRRSQAILHVHKSKALLQHLLQLFQLNYMYLITRFWEKEYIIKLMLCHIAFM